jgi:hypothetical protein
MDAVTRAAWQGTVCAGTVLRVGNVREASVLRRVFGSNGRTLIVKVCTSYKTAPSAESSQLDQ